MGVLSMKEMMECLFGNLLTGISPSSGFECSQQRWQCPSKFPIGVDIINHDFWDGYSCKTKEGWYRRVQKMERRITGWREGLPGQFFHVLVLRTWSPMDIGSHHPKKNYDYIYVAFKIRKLCENNILSWWPTGNFSRTGSSLSWTCAKSLVSGSSPGSSLRLLLPP